MDLIKGYKTTPGEFYGDHQQNSDDYGVHLVGLPGNTKFLVDTTDRPKPLNYNENIQYIGDGLWTIVNK